MKSQTNEAISRPQGLIYCILLFMSAEAPIFATTYGVFLQPLVVISILLGIYGLTIVTKSLQEINPGIHRNRNAFSD
jgi:hypothetical protein